MTKLISTGIAGITTLSAVFAIALAVGTPAHAQYYGGSYGYNNSAPNSYGGDFSGRTYYPRLNTNGWH